MVQHLGKIEHIDIYFDPDTEKDNFIIFGRKGGDMPIGNIFVPMDKLGNLKNIDLPDLPDNAKHLLKEDPRKFEDYEFAIGPFSTMEPYQKAINKIKK